MVRLKEDVIRNCSLLSITDRKINGCNYNMFPTEMTGTYCNEGKLFMERKEKGREAHRKKRE